MYVDQEFIGERNILCDVMQKGKIFHRPIRTAAQPILDFREKMLDFACPTSPSQKKNIPPLLTAATQQEGCIAANEARRHLFLWQMFAMFHST